MIQNINDKNDLGKILKQQRLMAGFTLSQLGVISRVSASYLGRIERGDCYPSPRVRQKIAKSLGISERGLFTLAGFLSHQLPSMVGSTNDRQLDPYVATVLSQESVEIQRSMLAILSALKSINKGNRP